MGRADLTTDARFADILSRHANHDALDRIIAEWTSAQDARELADTLQRSRVAASAVMSGEDIFDDAHYQSRGLLELVDHPSAGVHFLPGAAWKMSETPGRVRWHAPRLGEHNRFVFGELLGMTDSRIERMDREGVTGTSPAESV